MKLSLLLSTILHILLIALLIPNLNELEAKAKNGQGEGEQTGTASKEEERKIIEINLIEQGEQGEECPNHFGGIGVHVWRQGDSYYVVEVYNNYPAHKADILERDILTPTNGEDIEGEVGTILTLQVVRDGITLYKTITREKICLE